MLDFVHQLVSRYTLSEAERQAVDITSYERGGYGTRGYGQNKQGLEIGWWVHPDRYQKELNWLLDNMQLEDDKSILSVACGPAFHEVTLAYFFPRLQITATDFDLKEIKTAQQVANSVGVSNVSFRRCTAESTSIVARPHSFDYIMSMAALHDVVDSDAAFQGMARLLKPQGRLIFTYNPGRRVAQFPTQRPLEEVLERYFNLIHGGPLITPEDALKYYGNVELKSRNQRGYGLIQEVRIAIPALKR